MMATVNGYDTSLPDLALVIIAGILIIDLAWSWFRDRPR